MKGKITKMLIATMCISLFYGYISGDKIKKEQELKSSDVTLITKVLPHGEVGYAVACDFGTKVEKSKLSKESFKVECVKNYKSEARTITKVYTNDALETSKTSKPGRYVIIELDPDDTNSATLTYNEKIDQSVRNDLKYYVTLKENIRTSKGVEFKASNKKILDGKEVTPIVNDFKSLTYEDSNANKLNYRLFKPKIKLIKKNPLVIFLHGSGERGNDNSIQLLSSRGAVAFAEPSVQEKNLCYVLAPQAPHNERPSSYWCEEPMNSMVINLIKEIVEKYNIDENRIYITGLSNGGDGVWNLIEKNNKFFAAGIPIAGVTDSNYDIEKSPVYAPVNPSSVNVLKDIPIWVFHAEDDPAVDVRNSREMVEAIKKAGGNLINYTEYSKGEIKPVGHLSWTKAYENSDLIDWMFRQSNNERE